MSHLLVHFMEASTSLNKDCIELKVSRSSLPRASKCSAMDLEGKHRTGFLKYVCSFINFELAIPVAKYVVFITTYTFVKSPRPRTRKMT